MLKLKTLSFHIGCDQNSEKIAKEKISKYISRYISIKNYNISSKVVYGYDTEVKVYIEFKNEISFSTLLKILSNIYVYTLNYRTNSCGEHEVTVNISTDILNN